MEEKKKVIFSDDGFPCEHLVLNESQLRLLKHLSDNNYLYNSFSYEVLEKEVNWMEI